MNLATLVSNGPFIFLSPAFTVCTALSACPFDEGWYGAVVICLMPFLLMNSLNSALVNDDPLSETTTSGSPWLANNILSLLRVASVDVDGTTEMSIHLEYESTVINSILSMNGPAWSIWIRVHGFSGHSHSCIGAAGGNFLSC